MSLQFSIIIATYNSEKTLQKTLNSLLNQTYQNFEVILIDGASKDETVEIIKENKSKFSDLQIPYYWSSEKDSGIYDAWNKGLKKATTNWISFLGSDDTYYAFALENYFKAICKSPDINYISSRVELINESDKVIKIFGKPFNYNQMSRYMNIGHVGSFHHIDLFKKYGDFSNNYKIAGDYEFFLRCNRYINAGFVNKIMVKMLNTGVSNNHIAVALKENLKIQLKHKRLSFIHAYFEFYLSHLKAIRRSLIS